MIAVGWFDGFADVTGACLSSAPGVVAAGRVVGGDRCTQTIGDGVSACLLCAALLWSMALIASRTAKCINTTSTAMAACMKRAPRGFEDSEFTVVLWSKDEPMSHAFWSGESIGAWVARADSSLKPFCCQEMICAAALCESLYVPVRWIFEGITNLSSFKKSSIMDLS
jgi:hypothetical protein